MRLVIWNSHLCVKQLVLKQIIISFACILTLHACQEDKDITHEIVISREYEVKVPVEPSTSLVGLRLLSFQDSIIYLGDNETIYFYDLQEKLFTKDTFLRSQDYILYGKLPIGIMGNQMVFHDLSSIAFYNVSTHVIKSRNTMGDSENSIIKDVSLSTSASFGTNNRIYRIYIPFVSRQNSKEQFMFYLFDGQHTQSFELNLPAQLLKLIYDCNSNLIHPYMEPDHLNGGFTLTFPLSCRIFHFGTSHEITEKKIINPECECEITQQNFVKATPRNFFPRTLPLYGGVFSDPYRNLYYQFYKAPLIPGEEQRVSYLRILNDQFSLLASIEIDWNVYTANLLILEEGTFIQSSSPPDEKYLYFQKLELVEK